MATTPSGTRNRGFTLIELMVVVMVLGVVSAIALPSFGMMIRTNRVTTNTNELLASLSLARMEAIRNNTSVVGNRDVVMCPSTDGATCATNWSAGWIVARRVDDAVVTVLRHTQSPTGVTITGASNEIVFDNRGRRREGPPSLVVQVASCKLGEPGVRTLNISAAGQVRVVQSNCP